MDGTLRFCDEQVIYKGPRYHSQEKPQKMLEQSDSFPPITGALPGAEREPLWLAGVYFAILRI